MNSAPLNLMGWAGPEAAKRAWDRDDIQAAFMLYPRTSWREYKRYAPWDQAVKIATGQDRIKHYAQEIGDCVSHGMKNALEYQQCSAIMLGELERFAYIFTPYLYAAGRNSPEGGNGQLRNSDGSLGSWQIAACQKYGVLFFADDESLNYSGSVAKSWGNSTSTEWKKWIPKAQDNLIKSASKLTSGEQIRDCLCNCGAVTVASGIGFNMQLKDQYGKSWAYGSAGWSHQMCYIAYAPKGDTGNHPEAVFCMNSWGDTAHGKQLDGPDGGFWITLEKANDICKSSGAEVYGISAWDGMPANELDLVMAA